MTAAAGADIAMPDSQQAESRAARVLFIVDCDVHVHESPRELLPYCDMPWKKALEAIQDVPERYLDLPGFSPGESAGGYQAKFPTGHDSVRMVHTPAQMRSELSELHVDFAILFPDHLLKLAVLTQIEYRLLSPGPATPGWPIGNARPTSACSMPHRMSARPQDAAREIGATPITAGRGCLPLRRRRSSWGHRKYDPIFRAAEQADLPVLLTASTSPTRCFRSTITASTTSSRGMRSAIRSPRWRTSRPW